MCGGSEDNLQEPVFSSCHVWAQGSDSGPQAWQRVLLSIEASHRPQRLGFQGVIRVALLQIDFSEEQGQEQGNCLGRLYNHPSDRSCGLTSVADGGEVRGGK